MWSALQWSRAFLTPGPEILPCKLGGFVLEGFPVPVGHGLGVLVELLSFFDNFALVNPE